MISNTDKITNLDMSNIWCIQSLYIKQCDITNISISKVETKKQTWLWNITYLPSVYCSNHFPCLIIIHALANVTYDISMKSIYQTTCILTYVLICLVSTLLTKHAYLSLIQEADNLSQFECSLCNDYLLLTDWETVPDNIQPAVWSSPMYVVVGK